MTKPYHGTEPYIFISYAHRDKEWVLPVIAQLQQDGYRVWYDEGIDPGTEWDENIATHISGCGYFIAFLSANYLQSDNCKDELNFARDLNKERLLVYLENVQLPPGMAMRLNRLQAIHKYTYADETAFYHKLYQTKDLSVCKGEQTSSAGNGISSSPSASIYTQTAAAELLITADQFGSPPAPIYTQTAAPAAVSAFNLKDDNFVIANGTLRLFIGSTATVQIPEGVISIASNAFAFQKQITEVQLPASLRRIEKRAFAWCSNLQTIQMSDSVSFIGEEAFAGCEALDSISIPASIETLEQNAFAYCSALKTVRLSRKASAKVLYANAFTDCSPDRQLVYTD